MHTSVQPCPSFGDEMLLYGMSLAFTGVSHKLKLASLGSHLGAIGHYPLLYASLCPLWVIDTWSTCLK